MSFIGIVARWIFSPIGAFVCWMFKGFKGKFEREFNEDNSIRNFFVGIFAIGIIVSVFGFLENIIAK